MKKIAILSAVAFLVLQHLAAQAHIAPQKVSVVFSAQYPDAAAHWKTVKTGYEATFHAGDKTRHAYYTPAGGWLRTETTIHWTKNLPPAVRKGFRNSVYASYYVEHMVQRDSAEGQIVTIDVSQVIDYQMGGLYKDVYRLYFSMDGRLLKTEKVS